MPGYIQIEGDPTKWWFAQPFQAGQLTGQPVTVQISAPVVGTLVLSGRPGSIVVFNLPSGQVPNDLDVPIPAVYVPTTSGISEGHVGYELPASADLDTLASQIGGGLDGEPGGHRADLLKVSMPLCIAHHVSDDREKVQQAEDDSDGQVLDGDMR